MSVGVSSSGKSRELVVAEEKLSRLWRSSGPRMGGFVAGCVGLSAVVVSATVRGARAHPSPLARRVFTSSLAADALQVAWMIGKQSSMNKFASVEQLRASRREVKPLRWYRFVLASRSGLLLGCESSSRRSLGASVGLGAAVWAGGVAAMLAARELRTEIADLADASEDVQRLRRK